MTKMKKNLRYNIIEDCMYQNKEGLMEVRIQNVTFSKTLKDGTIWFIKPVSLPILKNTNWFHCLQTIWN